MRIIQLIVLLSLLSCQNIDEKRKSELHDTISDNILKMTQLISSTFNLPALQKYYKVQETLKQNELVLLENEFVKDVGKLEKFNYPIKIYSKSEIQDKGIKAYLEYKSIKINGDTAFVHYRYDVQGIGIESSYLYKKREWVLLKYDLCEN